MIICRGTNETNGQLFTSLFRDKLSLQGARITHNAITGSIMAFINMGLDDGHREILVGMTPEVNINAKTHAIVDPS